MPAYNRTMARKSRSRSPAKGKQTPAALLSGIIEEHARHPHPNLDGQALRVHLLLHQIVEKQLLDNEPPEAPAAMAALLGQGLARHQAVHVLARAVARFAIAEMRAASALDLEKYRRQLSELAAHPHETEPADG